jgi:hypothetical protein
MSNDEARTLAMSLLQSCEGKDANTVCTALATALGAAIGAHVEARSLEQSLTSYTDLVEMTAHRHPMQNKQNEQ